MMNHSHTGKIYWLLIFTIISFQRCASPSVHVTQEQQLGDHYYNQYQYEQAIVHYRNSLTASAKLGNLRNQDMEAGTCRKLAQAFAALGKFNDAVAHAITALDIDSIQKNQLEIIEDHRLLGMLNLYKGDFRKGIYCLEQAMKLNKGMELSLKGQNQLSAADTYLSLAQVYTVLGKFEQAGENAMLALDLYKKLKDKAGIMEAELLRGKIYADLGLIPEGMVLLKHSKALAEELNMCTARHHQLLGEVYAAQTDYEESLRHKIKALDGAEQSRVIPQIIWANIGVGDAYASLGDAETAKNYYEHARKIQDTSKMEAMALRASGNMRLGDLGHAGQYYSSINAGVATGLILLRMGEMNHTAGKTDSAIRNYSNAIDYFSRSQMNEGMAAAFLGLGELYIEENDYIKAGDYLTKALQLTSNDEILWEVWYQKGRVFELTLHPDSAVAAYKKAVTIIEDIRGRFTIEEYKSKYIDNKVKVYDRLILLLLESGAPEEAFLYAERARARAFLDMIGNQKINTNHTDDQELITREQDLRLRINTLSGMVHSINMGTDRGLSAAEVEEELSMSRKEYSLLMEQIKLKNKEYASMVSIEPSPLNKLQAQLDNQTVLLAYWTGDEYMAIWILGRNTLVPFVEKIPAETVTNLVTDARRAVRKVSDFADRNGKWAQSDDPSTEMTKYQSAQYQLRKVYDHLIKPVEGYFGGAVNLGIIPNGALHFLPFQALIMPDSNFLIEKFNIFYTPSANVYGFCKIKEYHPAKQILAMALGNLELKEFSGLPGTKQEVEQIQNVFNDITVKYENESTETFAKNNASSFRYIHLATHGLLDAKQPLYSYLLFAPSESDDGFLTVNEVFGLNLNASLVTLSACQTGMGDLSQGDELIGFSRAFLYAGTPAMIVSLWSVADQPTALLMKTFYRNLEIHSPQEALSMAQREVMKQYPAPFYWAPFQLIGRGD
ncbi:MAG: CHAT domain-containing protein [Bacteroidales bacterium]|nr:CHAT domain-containing protein [Bacteroidales bacterium]